MTNKQSRNVVYDNKIVIVISSALLDRQDAWDNLPLIRKLHLQRLELEDNMTRDDHAAWTAVQYKLQQAWGFPEDSNYHRFWELPGCLCPKLDNEDSYGTRWAVTAGDCPLHGGET